MEISFSGDLTLSKNSTLTPGIKVEFAAWFGTEEGLVGVDEDDWSYQNVDVFTSTRKIEIVTNDDEEITLFGERMDFETDLSNLIPWPDWPINPFIWVEEETSSSDWPEVASPITGGIYQCKSGLTTGSCESNVPGESPGWEEAWTLIDMYSDPDFVPRCDDLATWTPQSYNSGNQVVVQDPDNENNLLIFQCHSWPYENCCGTCSPYVSGEDENPWSQIGHCIIPEGSEVDWTGGVTYISNDLILYDGEAYLCNMPLCTAE